MDEDFTIFFDPEMFADEAIYTPDGGYPVSVNGIYDAHYFNPLDMTGHMPRFACASADVADEPEGGGGVLVVGGKSYIIKTKEDDRPANRGVALLVLQEQ